MEIFFAFTTGLATGALSITGAALYLEERAKNKTLQNQLQSELDADAQQPTILQYAN